MKPITESHIEQSAIETLQVQGWAYVNGKGISSEGFACERENFSQIILTRRLREADANINPHIPADAREAAIQKPQRQKFCMSPIPPIQNLS